MIIAKAIALALIPAGAAALGTVGYLQHQPRALTSDEHVFVPAPIPAVRVIETPKVAPQPEPVVVEPLVIQATPVARPRVAKKVAKLAPCTGWRNLGYDHVDNGKASGVNRVRELCDPTATAPK